MPGAASLPTAYQPGTIPGDSVLDTAPPSPAMQTGSSTGVPLGDLVDPMPTNQLPIPMLTGFLQSLESVHKMLAGYAQAMPQIASKIGAVQAALIDLSADVMAAGAGPTSPVNPGPQFPAGGLDSGGGPPRLA